MPRPKYISRSENIYSEFLPPRALARYVERIFEFRCTPLQSLAVNIRLSPAYSSSIVLIKASKSKTVKLLISGPNKFALPLKLKSKTRVICFKFKPLVFPALFNIGPSALLNTLTPFQKLPGRKTRNVTHALRNTDSVKKMIELLGDFILENISHNLKIDPNIQQAVDIILKCKGNIRLKDLYKRLPVNKRTFQRRFSEHTALTSKEFCEILRFETAIRGLIVNNYPQFDVLVESGYYDQSHFNKEFKRFSGLAPLAYIERQKTISFKNIVE